MVSEPAQKRFLCVCVCVCVCVCRGGLWNKRQDLKWKLNEETDGERERGVKKKKKRREKGGKEFVENFESDHKIQLCAFPFINDSQKESYGEGRA